MSTFMLYHLTWICISLPISQAEILWYYTMNDTIPTEWVKSGSISAITSLQSPTGLGSCPSATDYCWRGYASLKQNDWMLTRNTQSTVDYQNIQFTYQISTQLTVGNCLIEYTTNSGTNWQTIQSIAQQNVDINSSINTWNPSPNNNADGIQIRVQSVSADHGDRYCWFNEFKLTADKITAQPTTTSPTTSNPTTSPTTSMPTTSLPTTIPPTITPSQTPTTANPTTMTPTESPTTYSPTMETQSPTEVTEPPTIIPTNPSVFPTASPTTNPITLTPSTLPSNSPTTVSDQGTAIIYLIRDLIVLVKQNRMISVIIAAGGLVCICMICCMCACICCRKRGQKRKSKRNANSDRNNIAMAHVQHYPVKADSCDTHDTHDTHIHGPAHFNRHTVTPLRAPVVTAHVKVKKKISTHPNDRGLDWADPNNYGAQEVLISSDNADSKEEEEMKIDEVENKSISVVTVSEDNMVQQDIGNGSDDSLMRTQEMFLTEIDAVYELETAGHNSSAYHD